jgi:hypothetical protein
MRAVQFALLSVVVLCNAAVAASPPSADQGPPTIAAKTAKWRKLDGLFPLYWDAGAGKLWLEINAFDRDFLFVDSLPAGVGSNDIGLDRGQYGESRVVRFERRGPRVLLVQQNVDFRAVSSNAAERQSVADAFARSVLFGFDVGADEGGRVLVDATGFFTSDQHEVAGVLKRTGQGAFRLDATRSAIDAAFLKSFPRNSEVESTLTFTSDEPGKHVSDVAPNPHFVTVREHYSFVQLPPPGYTPRAFDPRAGFIAMSYLDFAAPIGQPLTRRFILRHRLRKQDPAAAISAPVTPIVYYLDRGAPEPVRSALLEGARWWEQAFAGAGFRDAFRVELLPEGVDPMDVRYNVIEWVHRATRGWSYGNAVIDPRTGEIIKGHVLLGSQRVRHDYLIFEGLLSPYGAGKPADARLLQTALARLRQLAAHEVGHTLGLQHNYIASTQGRASVMDYPHPLVTLAPDGTVDLAGAYATGAGEWDKLAIRYGYGELPAGSDEKQALSELLADGRRRGLSFLTDQDGRPRGSADPYTHLWDNGKDAVEELAQVLKVRAAALARFGEDTIPMGAPLATLEDALVPIYLFHRYQTEAATKLIAGNHYAYALRGDGQTATAPVPPEAQRRALAAVLRTLSPETLTLPETLVARIPPRPSGYPRTREDFATRTTMFDPLAAAEGAAELTLATLFDGARAARLVEQHARDARQPSLDDVLTAAMAATWRAPRRSGLAAEVQRTVDAVLLHALMRLAVDTTTSAQVRASAFLKLDELRRWARGSGGGDAEERAHRRFAAAEIDQFEKSPESVVKSLAPVEAPPGQPIGSDED